MPKRGENIRKRKDGLWEGRYVNGCTPEGKSRYSSIYGKNYSEVKDKLIQAKGGTTQKGTSKALRFKDVLFLWLENQRIKLRPQTFAAYKRAIDNHIVGSLGKLKVAQLDVTTVNQFLKEKLQKGRLDGNGGLASGTVKTLAYIITATIHFAVMQGWRGTLTGEIVLPKQRKTEIQVLTKDEQERLECAMRQGLDGSKIGVLLSLNTGLRIGEICGLKWEDVDFKEKTITVRRTVQRVSNGTAAPGQPKTRLVLGEPKTVASCRVIPLPSFLFPILLCQSRAAASKFVVSDRPAVLDPRTLQYRFKKYLRECNIANVNFHALRHTFATRCVESGMDVKSLSELLGHSNVGITLNTYVHSSLEQKRRQMERFCADRGKNPGMKTA